VTVTVVEPDETLVTVAVVEEVKVWKDVSVVVLVLVVVAVAVLVVVAVAVEVVVTLTLAGITRAR
jgi:hypothetical protein